MPPELQHRLALGTGFFFPMHHALHLEWNGVGRWIVAFAGMAMPATLVSGLVLHRRIFREFFTFRPGKARLRSTLDLHDLTGVVALPFLFERKRKHAAGGILGARIVDALAVTMVTGMVIATAGLMLANRVLPVELPHQDIWQQSAFWLIWLAALVHASVRSGTVATGGASPAWREQG